MRLDNAQSGGKAKARSPPFRFRRKKWIENLFEHLSGDAFAGILNRELHLGLGGESLWNILAQNPEAAPRQLKRGQ